MDVLSLELLMEESDHHSRGYISAFNQPHAPIMWYLSVHIKIVGKWMFDDVCSPDIVIMGDPSP